MKVEANIGRSAWRWVFVWGLCGLIMLITWMSPLPQVMTLFWLLIPWAMYCFWQGECDFLRIRIHKSELLCWDSTGVLHRFEWHGEGRSTTYYLKFEITNENDQATDLVIWRDSVSDASWRALNMAYRVLSNQLASMANTNGVS